MNQWLILVKTRTAASSVPSCRFSCPYSGRISPQNSQAPLRSLEADGPTCMLSWAGTEATSFIIAHLHRSHTSWTTWKQRPIFVCLCNPFLCVLYFNYRWGKNIEFKGWIGVSAKLEKQKGKKVLKRNIGYRMRSETKKSMNKIWMERVNRGQI